MVAKLKNYLKDMGITQAQIEEMTGVRQQTISRWITTPNRKPRWIEGKSVAHALGMSMEQLDALLEEEK